MSSCEKIRKRIIYASSTMSENIFAKVFKDSANIPGQQAQKYNRLLLEGLKENDIDIISLSTPPITRSNFKEKYLFLGRNIENEIEFHYIPIINLPIIKNVLNIVFSFIKSVCLYKKNRTTIICDVLNISIALGAVLAGKFLKCPIVGIVTDIPELMVTGHSVRQSKLIHKIIKMCSHYVFLTEPMNERLNKNKKPYVIIEGICDKNESEYCEHHNNQIIYAGYLDEKYGVKSLIEAFILANVPEQELHIYGAGPFVDSIKKYEDSYDSIVFHGTVLNDIVVKAEKKAKLLVNPRPSSEEFTMYSFPSKNMEYMISGTPLLTTKLAGMTEDYYDYIYCFESESIQAMSETLKNVLNLSSEELQNKGMAARQFVSENKNKIIQAKKILRLIEN